MFYKLNAARVTMREFWWETKLFCWVGLLVKIFQIRLRGSSDDLAVDSLRPFQVEQTAIRPDVLARFEPTLQQLTALGFGPPVWHDQENVYQATRSTLATLLHSNGRTWARVQCRTNHGRVPAKRKFFTTFISKIPGGFIATGNGKYDMAWPKTHNTVRFRTMEIGPLYARHQKRMTAAVQPVSPAQLLDVAEEYHTSLRDFHLARGVFEPLGEEELAMTAAPAAPPPIPVLPVETEFSVADPNAIAPPAPPPLPPPDLMEIATLDELRRLQNKKVNWRSSIILMIVSAAAFIFFFKNSDRQQDWQYVAIVVGVLLVHELGHYIAMRVFGYRNLKMFFIPGFGAAVSGRNYNAPAWKKIVVSLMGPLPGIFLGIVCLALNGFLHIQLLYLIGLMAIVINAFNLIPILPLDGGWVAHAALFARHPKLDTGFRVVAAGLLIAISIFLPGSHFLLYVAIASLVALPLTNRLAIIVGELRAMPALGLSPDNQTIPPATARIILSKLRERFKRGLNAKLAAQHIASVFESLNARPPSVGATVGLLSLHGFAFVLALVVGLVALGTHGRNLLLHPMGPTLKYSVTSDQIASNSTVPTGPRNIVIMRFKRDSIAANELAALPANHPASRFGQTLLVSFTPAEIADQREFFGRYSKTADDIYVESARMRSNVQLTFKLPDTDDGNKTSEELQLYFMLAQPAWRLIPPWANDTDWPADPRAKQTEMRRLVKELEAPVPNQFSTETTEMKQLLAAQRSGDSAEVDRLQAQMAKNLEDDTHTQHQQLKDKFGHADFIDAWDEIHELKDWKLQASRTQSEIASQLGQWPVEKSDDLLATSGFTSTDPRRVVSVYCIFNQTDTGLPAMTRWLFTHGASGMHYQIAGTAAMSDDPDGDPN